MTVFTIHTLGDREHGLGHVVRMRLLANELDRRGHRVCFVSEPGTPGWDMLLATGLPLFEHWNLWRGVVICDVEHGPDARLLEHLRTLYDRVVTVYGGHSFPLAAPDSVEKLSDLVIVQSVFENGHGAHVLQGPRYMLIDPAYAACRPDFTGLIIVCMGGADPHALTGPALTAIADTGRDAVGIVGQAAGPLAGVNLSNHIALAVGPESLAEYFQGAALFVGALGMVAYEALAAGLPCILTNWSPNHEATTVELGQRVGAVNLGQWEKFDPARLRQAVSVLLADERAWRAASVRCRALVDGQGLARVVGALEKLG